MIKQRSIGLSAKEKLNFRKKITKTGCWQWTGAVRTDGYGVISFNKKSKSVHGLSAELYLRHKANGNTSQSILVLHKCDNKICFNPKHLFLGTQKENVRDAISKKRYPPRPVLRGTLHPKSKFSNKEITKIRKLNKKGMGATKIHILYPKVSIRTIFKILGNYSYF